MVQDNETGNRQTLPARDLMVFIGANPCTGWLAGTAALLETSVPGVFAAGDVRSGSAKRVASAVGEGAMAVRLVHEHLAQMG